MKVREVRITVGKHAKVGTILLMEPLEVVAGDTNTVPGEWEIHAGWVEISLARNLSPTIEEAILAGRLEIRDRTIDEAPKEAEGKDE